MNRLLHEGQYYGESLRNLKDDFVTLSLTAYERYCAIEPHSHKNPYLSLLTNGQYTEKSSAYDGQIRPGAILFRPAYYEHGNQFEEAGGHCFNIEFNKDCRDLLDGSLSFPNKLTVVDAGRTPSLYKVYLDFAKHREVDIGHVFDFFLELSGARPLRRETHCVKKTIDIIDNEPEVFHSLSSLAARVFVHPVYLSRIFKQTQGLTISEYQVTTKVKKSLPLLLQSNLSISEISFGLGFYDDAHYIRNFKRQFGFPPHRFRRNFKS